MHISSLENEFVQQCRWCEGIAIFLQEKSLYRLCKRQSEENAGTSTILTIFSL